MNSKNESEINQAKINLKKQLKKEKNAKYNEKNRSKLIHKINYYKTHYKDNNIPAYYLQTRYIEDEELIKNIDWIRAFLFRQKIKGLTPYEPYV